MAFRGHIRFKVIHSELGHYPVETWFDKAWWREQLDLDPPGYVGAGCGLPLSPAFSAIGYTRKVTEPEKSCERIGWLHYPDEESDRETAT